MYDEKRLNEIRARVEQMDQVLSGSLTIHPHRYQSLCENAAAAYVEEIPVLLAEIERLRALTIIAPPHLTVE